jgi:tRNA uracil 4-sulfurtransferase
MVHNDTIIFHYGEIALKSGNRLFFEEKLAKNIERLLSPCGVGEIKMLRGKIVASLLPDADRALIKERSKYIFGLERIMFAVKVNAEEEAIIKVAIELVQNTTGESFKVATSRQDKKFPLTSMEMSALVGEKILETSQKIVKMKNADIICEIEIGEKNAYVSVSGFRGPGGLPTGSQKNVLMMLSGGIDSPIAALRFMRRGATVSGVHFHSYPQTSRASLEKVKELAMVIGAPQGGMKIFMVPFLEVQKEIVKNAPPELRVVLYRRSMFRLAERIAIKNGSLALGTGESLGQVASQTLENMAAIGAAVQIPVLRPLLGFDKEETVNEARRFGTYEISIRPHDDCCSLFLPEHPETRAKLDFVLKVEKTILNLSALEDKCFAGVEEINIPSVY